MWMKAAAAVLLSLCLAVGSTATVWANAYDEKQAELDEVKRQMELMEQRQAKARRDAETATRGLRNVMRELDTLHNDEVYLNALQENLEIDMRENKQKMEETQKKLEHRRQAYSQRLRDIYIGGQINYLDVLFGAKDFGDFSSRMYLLERIVSEDMELLTELEQLTKEVNEREQKILQEMQEIKEVQDQVAASQRRMHNLRERRSQMLYRAQETQQESAAEMERLLALSENIASMLKQLEDSGITASEPRAEGEYMWPCRGPITSYFGWRTHPIFGTTRYHSGMDIAVDYGTPIHATNNGRVIYSDWMGGYGYCVMIDHGGGIVSLYAHNNELNVSEGQVVVKGQVVAYAGSTGYSTGPHCHFEIRRHGEVTEPLDYLPE